VSESILGEDNPFPKLLKLVKAVHAGEIETAVEYRDQLANLRWLVFHPDLPPRADLVAIVSPGHEPAAVASPVGTADATGQAPPSGLGRVGQAVVRLSLAGIEPVVELSDWEIILGCSRSALERMRRAGELPEPDFFVGKSPRWIPVNVRQYLACKTRKQIA
jgi:hypothetical protein